jgi:ubiquinone/menaquinone biosynthesis C-methylase UbiE
MEQEMGRQEQWQVTARAAELYERFPGRYILGPWAPFLVDAANLAKGERVLDVACGTGLVTRIASQRVGPAGRAVGIDLNPGMIAVARSLPSQAGAPIEWLERSALDLRLPDASFDAVLCQQGLQFFPDKPLALREMRRVLVRGGRLALSVWVGVGPYHDAVGEALAGYLGQAAARTFCASRQVPNKDELQRLATDGGFVDVQVRISRLNLHLPRLDQFALDHLASTPIAPLIAATDPEVRKKIGVSAMQRMRPYADGDGVSYPEQAHMVTARAQ